MNPARLGCALLVASTLAAQARQVTSLDGLWEVRAVDGKNLPAEPGFQPIYVPSSFESVLGERFDGVAEYRRRFTLLEPKAGERVLVRFAAVATVARVFVDEVEIGGHTGGWTPFACELPDVLRRPGEHELRVLVDEKVGHSTQGFLPDIAPHMGGIWQGVELVRLAPGALLPDDVVLWGLSDEKGVRLRAGFSTTGAGKAEIALLDGERVVASQTFDVPYAGQRGPVVELEVPVGEVRAWGPGAQHVYRARLVWTPIATSTRDEHERAVAFRRVEVEGRAIRLNGAPLVVRGILHWGYEPPGFLPSLPVSAWRDQMRWARSLGFNLIKACLWLPPPSFFDVALEEGMLVWQEYPAWHPDFSARNKEALLREYAEFFAGDKHRAPVVVRSLTCETGRGAADESVVKGLYETCKQVTGAALVEDDSSWIGWNRFHDFYDDHPYGNCAPWRDRLLGFDRHIREHGAKPFLLGEAIAADTWVDTEAVQAALGERAPWWAPEALRSMLDFEHWYGRSPGGPAGDVTALVPESKAYALQARKYQIEAFRRELPEAGYVVSVLRDISRARMGLIDDLGRPKWSPPDWSWHGDSMLVLDDARAIRSLEGEAAKTFRPRLRLAGSVAGFAGQQRLTLRTESWSWDWSKADADRRLERHEGRVVAFEPDATPLLSKPIEPGPFDGAVPEGDAVRRLRVTAGIEGGPINEWTFWCLPRVSDRVPDGVRIEKDVTPELLDWVEKGGRLLLLPGGKGGPRSQGLWFLRGAPFSHGKELFDLRELLLDLHQLDLDGPLFAMTSLTQGFDCLMGFWDSHDQREDVETWGILLEARLGEGRILACSLGLDLEPETPFDGGKPAPNPARAFIRAKLLDRLAKGPPPRFTLDGHPIEAWRSALAARRAELGGVWKLKPDQDDVGQRDGWHQPAHDDAAWIDSRAGAHWEAAGLPHHDGIAWYRKRFTPPDWWRPGDPLFAVFDGVDDSYVLYVNGRRVAAFGDPATKESVWLVRTHADVGPFLHAGENLLALRVVDHVGAGGLHRPVWLGSVRPSDEEIVHR